MRAPGTAPGAFAADLARYTALARRVECVQRIEDRLGEANSALFANFAERHVPHLEADTGQAELRRMFRRTRLNEMRCLAGIGAARTSLLHKTSILSRLACLTSLARASAMAPIAQFSWLLGIARLTEFAALTAVLLWLAHWTFIGGLILIIQQAVR